jgi:death-on-curing protein
VNYLTVDEVIALHDAECSPCLADRDLLESAVMAPQQSAWADDAYPDIHHKAAALMRGVAANHAFIDGNKRTSVLAVAVFYGFNGYQFVADELELVHLAVDIVVEHLDVPKIAERLELWAAEIPDPPDLLDEEGES